MNSENYHLYIIPNLPYKDYKPILDLSGWKKKENEWELHKDPYDYLTYYKEINFNNIKWSIFLREFPHLSSIIIFIKYMGEKKKYEFVDNIFNNIIKECKIIGIISVKQYTFKWYNNQIDFYNEKRQFKNNFLFSEISEKNELHQVELSRFLLKMKYDEPLDNFIKDNILTLVSLSEIAHELEHQFLKNPKHINQDEVLKTFWGHKMFLLACPASKIFPVFFKYNIKIINNWLDDWQMWLAESHKELAESQNILTENQNNILEQIHSVEGGILILTFFIIIDVVFTIVLEILHSALVSFVIALVSLFIIFLGMQWLNKKDTKNKS